MKTAVFVRARIRIVLSGLLVLGLFPVACHRTVPVRRNADAGPVIKDTARVGPLIKDTARVIVAVTDTSVVALFRDTAPTRVLFAEGRTFNLRTPGQRQALHTTLRKERALWQAGKPRDYQFLLRVGCFCPGRGWLLIEVRSSQPLRAWDRTGKSAALTDWNTFSIDGLYDNLERTADNYGEVQIAFDPRWHFPRYVRTVALPGPDTWSIIEVRGLRPI